MLKSKVIETAKEYNLYEPGDLVLVAVSGGADSTALLYALNSCKKELGIKLHVAHLNHMIRKREADLDLRYIQTLCDNLLVPLTVEAMDVPFYAKENKLGIELAARQVRYDFFERAANHIGAAKIAVGHTADDNVETFLMRLLRGSGIKGLCGIPAKRDKITRPLIKVWRRQVEDYVGALKLVPRRDYTNYESKYMRNRVRMKLIPQLKLYNINIREIILQTILLLTEDNLYLEARAEEALLEVLFSADVGQIGISVKRLKALDYSIQRLVVRKVIDKVKGDLKDFSYKHIHDILTSLSRTDKWEMHLPSGIYVFGKQDKLFISKRKPEDIKEVSFRYKMKVPGEVHIKEVGKRIRASLLENFDKDKVVSHDATIVIVDYDSVGQELVIRSKQEGDRFYPLGMKGSKKLQDLYVDEKIPANLRHNIPIVESGEKIVWVGGVRLDERAKLTEYSKKAIKLELV